MLTEFLTWWSQQMRNLAAPALKRFGGHAPDALLLIEPFAADESYRLIRRRRGRVETLAELPDLSVDRLTAALTGHRREGLTIRLARRPLVQEIRLPAAAAASLDQVLQYEMDRLTPFAASDVFVQPDITAHDRTRGEITVALTVVPRRWVRDILIALQEAGTAAESLEAALPDGILQRIPMQRVASAIQLQRRRLHRAMLALTAGLAAACVLLPLVRQSMALADAEERIAELRPRVEQVDMLRRRIAAGSAGSSQIAGARQAAARPLTVLAELTDVLPDDTWLTSVSLRENKVMIEGHSRAATRLIAALAAQPQLRNPAFAAPVVRADTGEDLFTIQAEVAP